MYSNFFVVECLAKKPCYKDGARYEDGQTFEYNCNEWYDEIKNLN